MIAHWVELLHNELDFLSCDILPILRRHHRMPRRATRSSTAAVSTPAASSSSRAPPSPIAEEDPMSLLNLEAFGFQSPSTDVPDTPAMLHDTYPDMDTETESFVTAAMLQNDSSSWLYPSSLSNHALHPLLQDAGNNYATATELAEKYLKLNSRHDPVDADLVDPSLLVPGLPPASASTSIDYSTPETNLFPLKISTDVLLSSINMTPDQVRALPAHERRQIRNKLSARQFRARKKEHMEELERQVRELSLELEAEKKHRKKVELENTLLRRQVLDLRIRYGEVLADEVDCDASTSCALEKYSVMTPSFGYRTGKKEPELLIPTAQDIHKDGLFSNGILGHPDISEPWMRNNMLVGHALVKPVVSNSTSDDILIQLAHQVIQWGAQSWNDALTCTENAMATDSMRSSKYKLPGYTAPLSPIYQKRPLFSSFSLPVEERTKTDKTEDVRVWLEELCNLPSIACSSPTPQ